MIKMPYFSNWITIILLTTQIMNIHPQRTYMRTCDCEYVVDGKCAYTLLLPMDKGALPDGTCNNNKHPNLPPDSAGLIQSRIEDITNNITALNTWLYDHSRMLNQLQSSFIGLQQGGPVSSIHTVENTDSNRNANRNSNANTNANANTNTNANTNANSNPITNSNSDTNSDTNTNSDSNSNSNTVMFDNTTLELIRHAHEQNTRIGNLEMQLSEMQVDYSKFTTELEVLKYNITQLTSKVEALSKSINLTTVDISRQDSTIDTLSNIATMVKNNLDSLLCMQRGLLVTGTKSYISEDNIKVSSQYDNSHGPNQARLNNTETPGAWCPAEPNLDEWIQVDLGTLRTVFAIVTRGRPDYSQWVTQYKLQYADSLADDPSQTEWVTYKDLLNDDMLFEGNNDQNTQKINQLWQPIRVRHVRIVPTAAYQDSNKCMRVDLLGCVDSP